jgi:endo-1,3(4)-beta-glucanase
MLAIQARSFNNYFYLQSSNNNHPAQFVQNKVVGILFENKCDYTSTTCPIPFQASIHR